MKKYTLKFFSVVEARLRIASTLNIIQMKNRFCKALAAIAIVLLSSMEGLQAQPTMQDEKPLFSKDRVLVKLANTPAMRSTTTVPGVAQTPPNLGITYSEIRLLNPSKGNESLRSFSTMVANDKQNNVYVLMLEEEGEQAVRRALEILNANPAVEIAEPAFYYQLYTTPNDPRFPEQYALQKINAQQAWNIATGSKKVVVGIIDTGIDGAHPDLAEDLWVNPNPNRDGYVNDINGYDFVNRKGGIPADVGSHGTHVSGIIGAKGNNGIGVSGINWDVSLAWLGVGLEGDFISIEAAIEALNYANNHNIQITNNSYGGSDYSEIFEDAIRNYNGLFVASAGNDSKDNDISPSYPANYNLPNVITVASTDQNDNLSYFSNYGANSVHIAAPGSDILSTVPNGQYELFSGTSMASPYVAGVAALMKSVDPDLSPEQIREILIMSARQTYSLNGFGILDAYSALTAVLSTNLNYKIDLSQNDPESAGWGWTFNDDVYTITGGPRVMITGNNEDSKRRVEVKQGETISITLDNASITGLDGKQSPLLLNSDVNVTITLMGTNTLSADGHRAGIETSKNTTLTITGTGSLTATGGSDGGAGIGGGSNGSGGNITITGDAVVTATGGLNAQGIGRGSDSGASGTFAINRNAVVIASSVGDTNVSNRTGGILFDGNNGAFYGTAVTIGADVTIPANLTIPENHMLIIPESAIFTIPTGITLTNKGTILNYGIIKVNGTLMNDNMTINLGAIEGMVTGNPALLDFPNGGIIDLSDNNPLPQGAGWTFSGNVYTVLDGADVTFTGTSANQRRIQVAANATTNITLNDVIIQGLLENQSPLLLDPGANLALMLEGTNTLLGGSYRAGIEVPRGTTLTIEGTGSLDVFGGWQSAGIGGSTKNYACGNITVNGGIVTACGGLSSFIGSGGAGIGGGGSSSGDGGNIAINGGVVTVTGVGGGAGIGSGGGGSAGTLTMNGNAIVFANSVEDMNPDRKTGGILVMGNATHWYGNNNFSLSHNVNVPYTNVLTIAEGKSLTIPSGTTLTNNSLIVNKGTITINGTLVNYNYRIINFSTINGTVTGNNPSPPVQLSNTINLSNGNPEAVGDGWVFANDVYTVLDGANVSITGTSKDQRCVEVAANATANIKLNDVSITRLMDYQTPLLLNAGAIVNLTIEGENKLEAGTSCAGIQTTGASIVIDGTGSLTANGGEYDGAGIGGRMYGSGGKVTINGGKVTAAVTNEWYYGGASGIGGGGGLLKGGSGGDITINGGIVTAIGTDIGSDIGGGFIAADGGSLTMDGNAVVFVSSLRNGENTIGINSVKTNIDDVIRGILFNGSNGTFYGESITIDRDLTIPASRILTVPTGATLTIPSGITLTNNGTVFKAGVINHGGNYGVWAGIPYIEGLGSIIDLNEGNPSPAGVGWIFANNVYTVLDGADVIVTGTSENQRRVEVAVDATANITLNNVNFPYTPALGDFLSPLLLNNGANVKLTLVETNSLIAGNYHAGIQVPRGTTLTISGTGSLKANGGWYGAGIGGGSDNVDCGDVTINGGDITAIGGGTFFINTRGAGIGGSSSGAGGNITINGGIVTAFGGSGNAGIGSGGSEEVGTLTMNGNAMVFSNGVEDMNTERKISGILFDDNTGTFYGESVTITDDAEIPDGYSLTVPNGATFTIPAGITLTNNGMVTGCGTINRGGIYGVWTGNEPVPCGENSIDMIIASDLKVYPNPVKDDIFIKLDLPIEKVEIYSLTGNLMISENNFNEKISVSTLLKGIYMLRVYTDKGMTISKIIKN